MKSYLIMVEAFDELELEAETPEEAKEKAVEIMKSIGVTVPWNASIIHERELDEARTG